MHIPPVERFTLDPIPWLLMSDVTNKIIFVIYVIILFMYLVLTGRKLFSFIMPPRAYLATHRAVNQGIPAHSLTLLYKAGCTVVIVTQPFQTLSKSLNRADKACSRLLTPQIHYLPQDFQHNLVGHIDSFVMRSGVAGLYPKCKLHCFLRFVALFLQVKQRITYLNSRLRE